MTDAPAAPVVAEPQDKSSRAVAILLAVAAIVAALITARASLVASDATGAWNQSVGEEQRRAAILLEGIRYVYGSEGDAAFMIAVADQKAKALREAAAGQPPDIAAALEAEAAVQQQLVDLVGSTSELASDPRYALPGGGYDLQRRLADDRATDPDTLALDPLATFAEGDAAAAEANRLMLATVGVGLAFLCGALAQAFKRHRRALLTLGWLALAAGSAAAVAVVLDVPGIAA